ncbi:MAG: diaminopimelate decarboxylase [Phenylobacterium sp.]|uniref:diaminopimelate decarboxylase n=1 Tax=Phenylobacterium sp. TaxID=1871053 RepID=UPI0025F62192|nr:diaminopimelate decarboxylase [Phenylobacterium sp.]MCA3746359.1 diaminopimelate decarboxylase [Phenylobacterium sp.]MCA3749903.1 diaminopimelate decarboxylase [Phenylobacterium sp.]MCA6244357.1 diaminopimelate decarboxylase [Phenylobacterium sp.]MCA6245648.1 diaminopimelate decarboxylase [Phenylobacterium sp.]MCA6272915.1 diaminopimelate decarboxylase [Phenylobacterium sp.]
MNHFELRDGEMFCEDVPLSQVAGAVGTPVYVYSSATLERHFTVLQKALSDAGLRDDAGGPPLIAYAVKANSNLAVLATLARLGAGADTVSEGEIRRALAAGVPPERIVFSGVGKQAGEIRFALETGISEINVESEPEMRLIAQVAQGLGRPARIAFRVNPDVAAGGHAKIATGGADNKFGVSFSEAERLYAEAANDPWLDPIGLTCHIGSQISRLEPMEAAFLRMRELVERLRARGLAVHRLDLGGGLGVPYFNQPEPPTPAAYAAMIAGVMAGLEIGLAFEPGRVIAANAGILLARVLHIHGRPEGRRFVVLDAAMNDLIRPAMYDAYHDIRPVRPRPGAAAIADVVGPVCETGDTFTRDRMLPPLEAGDLVAFMSAGAYGASMSSEYNSRLLVPEVLVRGADWAVVRPRPTYEEMLARESRPTWLD